MFISGRMHIVKIYMLEEFLIIFYLFIKVNSGGGAGCISAFICMGTHIQP